MKPLYIVVAGWVVTVVVLVALRPSARHEDDRVRRFEQHCGTVQLELQDGLRATARHDVPLARFFFERHAATEWREVRFCAPEGVDPTAGCGPRELTCMAQQFGRVLAWTTWGAVAPGAVVPPE